MTRALLRLSQGSYEKSIRRRNAVNRVAAMDLEGYFDHVYVAFFKADSDGVYTLSPRHTILDLAVTPGGSTFGRVRAELGFLRRVQRLIDCRSIRVIQANDPHISGLNALVLSQLARLPYVIEIVSDYDLTFHTVSHRQMAYLPSRRWEKAIERLVLTRASGVYADRSYYLAYARRNGVHPTRVFSVRCVTDPFYYSARPVRPLRAYADVSGKRVLLYVGRLSAEKYPLDLVDCLAGVRAAGEEAMLLLAGVGDLREAIRRRACQAGIAREVIFLGQRSAQELVDLMHGADVLLATHAGYALIEEALSGKPIVAYDYEWHPEFVRHEETGLLAPFRDAAALATQALRVLRDPALGQRLGSAARHNALANHQPRDAVADERRIYQRILGA